MHPPLKPSLEQLATLHEISRSLNTSLELSHVLNVVMDRVVAITGAERGFLMLVDPESQVLKFQVARGINAEDLEKPEFHVSNTIIHEVMMSGEGILTMNAQDERLEAESISVKGLRSILCVPIARRDELIGLVYLDNRLKAGLFDESHRYLVSAFAEDAGIAIENARLYQVAIERGRLQRELEMAYQIQQGLLPQFFEPIAGYEVAFAWQSAHEVAGDFYDCFRFDDEQMALVVADVSDKGAAAALFMAVSRSLLRGNAYAFSEPTEVVQRTNAILLPDASGGMFVTLYYASFGVNGEVRCVNAGHNLPILYRHASKTTEVMPRGGQPLGWFPDIHLREDRVQLQAGDSLVLYTDGLIETENPLGEPYGVERLADLLTHHATESAEAIKNHLLADVKQFRGKAPIFDDTTIVIVRYIAP